MGLVTNDYVLPSRITLTKSLKKARDINGEDIEIINHAFWEIMLKLSIEFFCVCQLVYVNKNIYRYLLVSDIFLYICCFILISVKGVIVVIVKNEFISYEPSSNMFLLPTNFFGGNYCLKIIHYYYGDYIPGCD